MKYVKSEENVCDYSIRHPYKDLLKCKEIIHYVNFVSDDATPNALNIDIIQIFTKNDKLSYQVIKLVRRNNCYKLNKPLNFMEYIKNRNTVKQYLKTDPSDLQNHVIPLAH